ncbi:unnamed protein product [Closterium sp. Naga37s-1]|nr:unnamed protein product [Closterium sp. Naga37s-1]
MEPSDRLASDQNVTQFVQSFITKVVQDIEVAFNPAHTQSLDDGAFDLAVAPINSAATDGSLVEDKDMLDVKYWDVNMLAGSVADPAKTLGGDGKVVTVKAGATAAVGLPSAAVATVPAGSSANGGGNPAGAMAGGGVIIPDVDPEKEGESEVKITNKLRRDAFLVFRALCKLSMKAPPAEGVVDPFAVRGKVVSLELLKICLENSGAVFRTNERFVGAVKQYLCLSLLKNCTSSLMSVFQLSCSIFFSLLTRFRSVLKAEIGVFFPMIVLRVLENVAHANFQQKMIVLRFLERLCVDPQILVDIFANYDCDVESTVSIFERMVSGLLKTAQGVPPGADSTLNAAQDQQLRLAAIKCMVGVLRSMGSWTNRQLCVTAGPKIAAEIGAAAAAAAASAAATAAAAAAAGEGPAPVAVPDLLSGDLLPDFVNPRTGVLPVAKSEEALEEEALGGMPAAGASSGNEISEASILEQRRAYKLELQEGINLFNKKPKKGIDFLIKAKKLGDGAEEIVAFLRKTEGLDKTMIGDFLGDRDDMSIKIMHAYMDSYNLSGMDFDEAIRSVLLGFRLPGEAQKIDRIMEKFAERYCRCNPKAFTSADTAYVLAYSVIMLNTDAHNPGVKTKMSKADFLKNNRGIDDGKDIPEEFLGGLYDRITRNEIKMKPEILGPGGVASKAAVNSAAGNALLGLESILNLMSGRTRATTELETSDEVVKHMQEQFRAKAGKSGSVFYAASDVQIIRPMVDVVWAPMLAAFSVPLETTEEDAVTEQCLEGFRYAVHVTAVIGMQMQRDAFVTSLAKFTSLHSAADIKQKNVDAIKFTSLHSAADIKQKNVDAIKFTSLHSAADIKQKNVDAIKVRGGSSSRPQAEEFGRHQGGGGWVDVSPPTTPFTSRFPPHLFPLALPPLHSSLDPFPYIQFLLLIAEDDGNYLQDAWEHVLTRYFVPLPFSVSVPQPPFPFFQSLLLVAEDDGNYLQDAWEHVLTCVSRYEHLHRIGEGAPTDSHFFSTPPLSLPSLLLVAEDDGNYLQDAWEHVLTCVSRYEHLHLIGEGAPTDSHFFSAAPLSCQSPSLKHNQPIHLLLPSPHLSPSPFPFFCSSPHPFPPIQSLLLVAEDDGNYLQDAWEHVLTLLMVAEDDGNYLQDAWEHVLTCVSRYEHLHLIGEGAPTDSHFFSAAPQLPPLTQQQRPQPLDPQGKRGGGRGVAAAAYGGGGGHGVGGGGQREMGAGAQRGSAADAGTPRGQAKRFGEGGEAPAWKNVSGKMNQVEKLVRRGSYDPQGVISGGHTGVGVGVSLSHLSPDQVQLLVANLGLLEQVGSDEVSRLFSRSERLNGQAIVEFVKALCKVSLEELRSPTEPRVYSLTKIVEIAHFNMSRIRLVWSRIWAVLADYFVTVGCMPNLSVAMYAIDSLRQLAMKFLEREELSNYNFQNEFLKPFVVVMRRTASVEIRELIIRCVSQMVFARVGNVKSGWKIMFMVFTTAATDDNKNIVLLAFETIEKVVREYFPYITETETTTFTDCVNCLIAFTNSRFNKDVSLNAIAFLRFCALKLAEGDLGATALEREKGLSPTKVSHLPGHPDGEVFTDKDDHLYFWFPLLAGLSELTFDPRPDIRKSALEVLFDTLRFHGHMFSAALWERVFESVLFPIFDYVRRASEPQHGETGGMMLGAKRGGGSRGGGERGGKAGKGEAGGVGGGGKGAEGAGADGVPIHKHSHHKGAPLSRHPSTSEDERLRAARSGSPDPVSELEMDAWLYETCTLALQLVVDLFVKFYSKVSPLLGKILALLTSFIRRPHQSLAAIGVAAFVRLMSNAGGLFSEEKWDEVLRALKETTGTTLPDLAGVVKAADLEDDEEREMERQQQIREAKRFDFTREEDEEEKKEQHQQLAAAVAEAVGAAAGGGGGADGGGDGDGGEEGGVEVKRPMTLAEAVADVRCKIAVQLLLVQVSPWIAIHLLLVQVSPLISQLRSHHFGRSGGGCAVQDSSAAAARAGKPSDSSAAAVGPGKPSRLISHLIGRSGGGCAVQDSSAAAARAGKPSVCHVLVQTITEISSMQGAAVSAPHTLILLDSLVRGSQNHAMTEIFSMHGAALSAPHTLILLDSLHRAMTEIFSMHGAALSAPHTLILLDSLHRAMTEIFSMHGAALSAPHTLILLDSLHRVGTHAHAINSNRLLRSCLQALHLATQMPDPPLLRLESEALHAYLSLLQRLPREKAQLAKEVDVELRLVILCEETPGLQALHLATQMPDPPLLRLESEALHAPWSTRALWQGLPSLQALHLATQMPDPPLLRLESEALHAYLSLLQRLPREKAQLAKEVGVELRLVILCEEVLRVRASRCLLLFFPFLCPRWVSLCMESR